MEFRGDVLRGSEARHEDFHHHGNHKDSQDADGNLHFGAHGAGKMAAGRSNGSDKSDEEDHGIKYPSEYCLSQIMVSKSRVRIRPPGEVVKEETRKRRPSCLQHKMVQMWPGFLWKLEREKSLRKKIRQEWRSTAKIDRQYTKR